MYAAAGGASLASRQARQRQRQNKKAQLQKTQKAQADLIPKQPQPKHQFHNYTDQNVPKLSRVERNALRVPQAHERRHSTSNYHLKEPSRARIRESPSICIPVVQNHQVQHHQHHQQQHQQQQPLTPTTLVQNHVPHSPSVQSQLPQIAIPDSCDKSLERRCSFVRQVEEMEKGGSAGATVLDRCNHICNFEIKEKAWENNVGFYAEHDTAIFGSWDYPFSECSQGRAAWQERERRRCSLSGNARQHRLKQSEAHHRWMKRNRIHDTGFGGSSDSEDAFGAYQQSAAANALLYVGLGAMAIGSVIFFVGTGDKGFKTVELRLIGPTLMACGLLCCAVRVLLCTCPSGCLRRRRGGGAGGAAGGSSSRSKDRCAAHRRDAGGGRRRGRDLVPADGAAARRDAARKKVSIAGRAGPSTSTTNEPLIYVEDELAAPRPPAPSSIPLIALPDLAADFGLGAAHRPSSPTSSVIELRPLDAVSSDDDDDVHVDDVRAEDDARRRPSPPPARRKRDDDETCLSVVIERPPNGHRATGDGAAAGKTSASEILLSPLQLDGNKM